MALQPQRIRVGVLLLGDMRKDYGGRRVASELLAALVSRWSSRFEFVVFSSAPIAEWVSAEALAGCREVLVPAPAGRMGRVLTEQLSVNRRLRDEGIAVVLAPNNVLPLSWGGPSVLMLQNVKAFTLPGTDSRLKETYRRVAMTRSVRMADRVVCVSNTILEEALRIWPDSSQRLRLAYNGVLADRLSPLPVPCVPDGRTMLFVSALRAYKRLDVAIGALDHVIAHGWSDARLVVAGTGDRTETSRATLEVERRGLTEYVEFVGRANDEQLAAQYSSAHVLVFPSAYESFGLPAAEAMSHGLPVVYALAEALPEIVGKAGLGVPLGDCAATGEACVRLRNDPVLWDAASKTGRANVSRYNWADMASCVATALLDATTA